MNFIKMLEEMIKNKEYEINNDTVMGLLVDEQTDSEYLLIATADDNIKWKMLVSYTKDNKDHQEMFVVIGPLDYYNMLFRYKIRDFDKFKEEYILPIDKNEEFQLDKKISRKRIFSTEFKSILLDFATDLKNERAHLDYLLENFAHLKIDALETFVNLDEEGKRIIIELHI